MKGQREHYKGAAGVTADTLCVCECCVHLLLGGFGLSDCLTPVCQCVFHGGQRVIGEKLVALSVLPEPPGFNC